MTTVGELQTGEQRTGQYGIILGVLAGSRFFPFELQRAPDSSGEPDTANAQTIAIRPNGPTIYLDYLENDQQTRWYRARHVKNTYTDSDWTNWVGAKPVGVHWYDQPTLPSYPRTDITQEQPASQPENVIVRLRGWPEHDDTVFRYSYVGTTEVVPLRSESTGDWETYSTGLTLGRDPSDVSKFAAWGDLNGIWGPISVAEVGPDLRPQITGDPTWTQGTGITVQSSYAAVKDAQTVTIDIYRRKDSWPTLTSSSGGPVDTTYYKGDINDGDGWAFSDGAWNSSEVCYEIAVPRDWNQNAGPDNRDSYTVSTGSASPQITAGWAETSTGGTSCTTGQQRYVTAYWDTVNATSATHDMRVYYRTVGISTDWTLSGTETDPIGTTHFDFYVPMYESTTPKAQLLDIEVRLDLWDGSTADDTRLVDPYEIYRGIYCSAT